ncbi:hypothetical protein [Gordonia sp. SL306]|uniref:hypothetical protein n=1 Tax=Gordonia sp. SL306 TaxID=2995145 RepID=UPI00226E7D71|nr:hypothetical protein [Gordonia sp. SL306]WAC54270.1 hypothetical protein OVA31_16455 [Gordonia sp. SL306]
MSNQPTPEAEVIKAHIRPSGQIDVVIRCPHCKKQHWHGGGAGHRLAHCAGFKAEKLRREHGQLAYEITQADVDRHIQEHAA